MTSTTKIIIAVAAVAAIGGAAFWAYKKHPEWFSRSPQNPNQVNPAAAPIADKTAQRIAAGSKALDSLSNAAAHWLG